MNKDLTACFSAYIYVFLCLFGGIQKCFGGYKAKTKVIVTSFKDGPSDAHLFVFMPLVSPSCIEWRWPVKQVEDWRNYWSFYLSIFDRFPCTKPAAISWEFSSSLLESSLWQGIDSSASSQHQLARHPSKST